MVGAPEWVPARGDVVYIDLNPRAGHEQGNDPGSRRSALVLSSRRYNRKVGLLWCCPITTKPKGYPGEIAVPPNNVGLEGMVLIDHLKSFDWHARPTDLRARLPQVFTALIVERICQLLRGWSEP